MQTDSNGLSGHLVLWYKILSMSVMRLVVFDGYSGRRESEVHRSSQAYNPHI